MENEMDLLQVAYLYTSPLISKYQISQRLGASFRLPFFYLFVAFTLRTDLSYMEIYPFDKTEIGDSEMESVRQCKFSMQYGKLCIPSVPVDWHQPVLCQRRRQQFLCSPVLESLMTFLRNLNWLLPLPIETSLFCFTGYLYVNLASTMVVLLLVLFLLNHRATYPFWIFAEEINIQCWCSVIPCVALHKL